MKTTLDCIVGRREDACEPESVNETLDKARRIFADVSSFLEAEINRLYRAEVDDTDEKRVRALVDLIRQNQAAMRTVLDIRTRLGCDKAREERQMLDLEAARAEILGRLDRLAS